MEIGPKQPHEQQHWLDVTIEEIESDIINGDTELALDKAKKRFDAVWKMYQSDIDNVVKKEGEEVSTEEWVGFEDVFAVELIELGTLMIEKLEYHEIEEQLNQVKYNTQK